MLWSTIEYSENQSETEVIDNMKYPTGINDNRKWLTLYALCGIV